MKLPLDLVLLTHGSPPPVLGFERRQTQPSLPGMDFGLEILEKALGGLTVAQETKEIMSAGDNAGVVMAWRDVGVLFQ